MNIVLTLFFVLIFAIPVYAIDGNKLLEQVDRNLNPESYESYKKLINIEPDGSFRRDNLKPLWRGRGNK